MPFNLSSTITFLHKEGISIADSGKVNARRVSDEIHKRLGGRLPVPDFVGLQLALVRIVEDDLALLLATDASHVHGLVGSRLQVRERKARFAQVFETLSNIRGAIGAVYGDPARIELFGDVSALPQDPLALHRLGTRVHDQLLDDGFRLPELRLAGFATLDRAAAAAGLKAPLDRLGEVLATRSLERKDADATLFDKNAGVEEFKRTVRNAGGCLAALYRLAGFDDLADKIRPKRRASRRAGDGGEPAAGSGLPVGSGESGDRGESESSEPPTGGEETSEPAGDDDGAPADGPTGPIGIVR